jgi:hypothetical protein
LSQNLIRSLLLSTLKHKDFINHSLRLLIGFFKFFWLIPVSSVAGDEQLPATCFYSPSESPFTTLHYTNKKGAGFTPTPY